MNDQQDRRVNEAAERFAESLTGAYQALADRSVSARDLNAQLTQSFFNRVIENLGAQAEGNRVLADNLAAQQYDRQEASQALARESVNAYMDFLGSVFAFPRQRARGDEPAGRDTADDPRIESGEEEGATLDDAVHHPLSSWVQTSQTVAAPPGSVGPTPREEPPPGEERPGRRGAVPTSPPTAREEPPPGEERPGRRTP